MPLRTKLILILAGSTVLSLLIFVGIAYEAFVTDRISSIYEESQSLNRFLAGRFQAELKFIREKHQSLKNQYDQRTLQPSQGQDTHCVFVIEKATPQNRIVEQMGCTLKAATAVVTQTQITVDQKNPEFFKVVQLQSQSYLVYSRFDNPQQPQLAFVSVIQGDDLTAMFLKQSYFSNYLLSTQGDVVIGPQGTVGRKASDLFPNQFFVNLNAKKYRQGTFEANGISKKPMLVSYEFLENSPYFLISTAPKSIILRAIRPMLLKCGFALLALIIVSLLLSVVTSKKLTDGLEVLRSSMRKFGFGELTAVAQVHSDDEIGELAKYFNDMTKKIRNLITESEHKVELQKELETAKRVQETLLPTNYFKFGKIEIAGHYEPANQCGGDWWYYFEIGNKLYLCIGDVTGHGVPSALMTSASRATISLLQRQENLKPADILRHMNIAIHDSSRGELQMTFFAAMLDKETLELVYSNASHEIPMIFPKKEGKITTRDITFLDSSQGRRIGEDLTSEYEDVTTQLTPGDKLFFYTDGVTAVTNLEKVDWPEREFMKALTKAFSAHQRTLTIMDDFKEALYKYRQETILVDDVSFFVVSLDGKTN